MKIPDKGNLDGSAWGLCPVRYVYPGSPEIDMDIILCGVMCANPGPRDLICPSESSGVYFKGPSELPIKCISVKVELPNT